MYIKKIVKLQYLKLDIIINCYRLQYLKLDIH